MSEASATLARRLAMLSHARHHRRGQRALLRDRVLRVLLADLVAARTAAGRRRASRDSRAPGLPGPLRPSADDGSAG